MHYFDARILDIQGTLASKILPRQMLIQTTVAKAIPSTKKGRSKKAVKEESIEENNAKAAVKSPKVNRVTVKRGRGKTTAPADVLNTDEESPTAGGPSNDIKNGNELENKALEAIVDEDAEAMEPVAKKKGGKAKKTFVVSCLTLI